MKLEEVYTLPISSHWQDFSYLSEVSAKVLVLGTSTHIPALNHLAGTLAHVDAIGPDWIGLCACQDPAPPRGKAHCSPFRYCVTRDVMSDPGLALLLNAQEVLLECPEKPRDPRAPNSTGPGWNTQMDHMVATPLMFKRPAATPGWYVLSLDSEPDNEDYRWTFAANWLRPCGSTSGAVTDSSIKPCNCTMLVLMRDGCRCGAMASERKANS